jgi:hypothetical protein
MATSDDFIFDLDNVSKEPNQPKSIYAGDVYGGQPSVTVTNDGIWLAGSKTSVINITDEYGVHLTGNISLSANPNQISIAGGYWVFNPMIVSCIPSTSATPIPVLVRSTPHLLKSQNSLTSAFSSLGSNGL